jgi:predicted dehydrogenase
VPARYQAVALDPSAPSYTVGQAYARLVSDLREGTEHVPTFADAVLRHRTLAAVERAAATGKRQSLAPD